MLVIFMHAIRSLGSLGTGCGQAPQVQGSNRAGHAAAAERKADPAIGTKHDDARQSKPAGLR
jgi:hypothetical protein